MKHNFLNKMIIYVLLITFPTSSVQAESKKYELSSKTLIKTAEVLSVHKKFSDDMLKDLSFGRSQEDRKYLKSIIAKNKNQDVPRLIAKNETRLEFSMENKDYTLDVVDMNKGLFKLSGCEFRFNPTKSLAKAHSEMKQDLKKCNTHAVYNFFIPQAEAAGILGVIALGVIVLSVAYSIIDLAKWYKGPLNSVAADITKYEEECQRISKSLDSTFDKGIKEAFEPQFETKKYLVEQQKKYCAGGSVTVSLQRRNITLDSEQKTKICQDWAAVAGCWDELIIGEFEALENAGYSFVRENQALPYTGSGTYKIYNEKFTVTHEAPEEEKPKAKPLTWEESEALRKAKYPQPPAPEAGQAK